MSSIFDLAYRPDPVIIDDAGNLNPYSVQALQQQVDQLTQMFNAFITHQGDSIQVVTPSAANTEFTVKHNLGFTPTNFDIVYSDKGGSVYASRQFAWTPSTVYLKCTTATTTIRLRLY